MTKLSAPLNTSILINNSFTQSVWQWLISIMNRLNAASGVTTLADDGDNTASGTYQQAELQAVMDKLDELNNALK